MRSIVTGGLAVGLAVMTVSPAGDPLPSWNDTAAKRTIVEFVGQVTREDSPGFVPAAERIAVFDNDGTLWSEQPVYVQLAFTFDRLKALAPRHPEWKDQQPFAALLEGDFRAALAGGGTCLPALVHHTDADREWAYDKTPLFGRLDKALDEARVRGWTVISMTDDWRRIFPFEDPEGR